MGLHLKLMLLALLLAIPPKKATMLLPLMNSCDMDLDNHTRNPSPTSGDSGAAGSGQTELLSSQEAVGRYQMG